MKKLIITLAVLGALVASAHASEKDLAIGASGVISYDKTCEHLSPIVVNHALRVKNEISPELYSKAAMWQLDNFLHMGKADWCATLKPLILQLSIELSQ